MVSWRSHMTLFHTYPSWWASQVVLGQRSCLPMQETKEPCIQSLSQEDPLEEGIATHSSILAGRIPWTEEPDGLQFIWSQRVGHDWGNLAHMHESPLISPLWSMPLLFSLWVRLISFPSRILELWNFGLLCFFFFPWPSSLSPLSLSKQGSTLSCQCVLLSTKQFWFRLKFVASLFYPTCSSTFKSAASSKSVHLYRTEQSLMVSYPCYMGYTPVSGLFHFTFVKCWLLPDELIL